VILGTLNTILCNVMYYYLFFQAHHCKTEQTIQLFGFKSISLVYLLPVVQTVKSTACLDNPATVIYSIPVQHTLQTLQTFLVSD